jgi:hypothetical protein
MQKVSMKITAKAPRGKDLRDRCKSLTITASGEHHEQDAALLSMLYRMLAIEQGGRGALYAALIGVAAYGSNKESKVRK